MSDFKANYEKILEVLHFFSLKDDFLKQIRKSKLKDTELIAMNLTTEYLSIDSECQLFRLIPKKLKDEIERPVYNRRKRKLFDSIEFIRNELSTKFTEFENYYIVDSIAFGSGKII